MGAPPVDRAASVSEWLGYACARRPQYLRHSPLLALLACVVKRQLKHGSPFWATQQHPHQLLKSHLKPNVA